MVQPAIHSKVVVVRHVQQRVEELDHDRVRHHEQDVRELRTVNRDEDVRIGEDGELVVEIDVVERNEDDSGGKRRESIHHALFVHHEPILAAARDPRDLLLRAGRGTSAVLAIEERAQPLRLLDVVDVREEVQVLQDELPLRGTQMDYASLEGHARVQVQ